MTCGNTRVEIEHTSEKWENGAAGTGALTPARPDRDLLAERRAAAVDRTQYAPGDPRLYDLDPDFLPVLVARVDEDGRWVVRCPYCRRDNTHSAEVGHRNSHCRCDGMSAPGRMGGYVLAPPGAQNAPYPDVCNRCRREVYREDAQDVQYDPDDPRLAVFSPVDVEGNGRSLTGSYVCYFSHSWVCTWGDNPNGSPAKPSGPTKRCALYRHYDATGTLLYVGISDAPTQRGKDHARESAWVQFAKRIEAEWLDSRKEAERAERLAIRREVPVFNVVHAVGDPAERMKRYVMSHTGGGR